MDITVIALLNGSITSRNYDKNELNEIEKIKDNIDVPQSISAAQGKLALIEYGKYQEAIDFINSISDPTEKIKAEVNFNQRNSWERNNPALLNLAKALNIKDDDLDKMFIFGAKQ